MASEVQSLRETSTACSIPEDRSPQQTMFMQSPATTPLQNPKDMALKITQAQKQALIDNLQLEVTERARKLRAQYALQAQSLRTRIELRINRIPNSLRKANMGELFTKYLEIKKQEQNAVAAERDASITTKPPSSEKETFSAETQCMKETSPARPKGLKRNSDEMENSGKENAADTSHPLSNPKKRTKVTAGQMSRQAPNPSTILSPKSSNSRTLPQSPIHAIHDPLDKTNVSRTVSPLKPMMPPKIIAPAKSAALTATLNAVSVVIGKTKSTRAKASTLGPKASNPPAPKPSKPVVSRPRRGVNNGPTETRSVSNTSNTSSTSTGTTIMRKGAKTAAASAPPASKNKTLKTGIRPIVKKTAPAVEAPPPGRRVLRKRT